MVALVLLGVATVRSGYAAPAPLLALGVPVGLTAAPSAVPAAAVTDGTATTAHDTNGVEGAIGPAPGAFATVGTDVLATVVNAPAPVRVALADGLLLWLLIAALTGLDRRGGHRAVGPPVPVTTASTRLRRWRAQLFGAPPRVVPARLGATATHH